MLNKNDAIIKAVKALHFDDLYLHDRVKAFGLHPNMLTYEVMLLGEAGGYSPRAQLWNIKGIRMDRAEPQTVTSVLARNVPGPGYTHYEKHGIWTKALPFNGDTEDERRMIDAATLLGAVASTMQNFDNVEDPFNQGNTLTGSLCRQGDFRYGALVITAVNGAAVPPQVIYGTTKLAYPFTTSSKGEENRDYQRFPAKVISVHAYEKLDGTNILQYSYTDVLGRRYVTYKTRLSPVLQESRFGNFIALWKEMLEKYPEIDVNPIVRSGEYTCSYELYGARNHHTILYEDDLETRLLFAVRQEDAKLTTPADIMQNIGVPKLQILETCRNADDLLALYERLRLESNETNRKVNAQRDDPKAEGDAYVIGTEGYVFYVLGTNKDDDLPKWYPFKCKPEMIEAMHWTTSSIPESIILPTIRNSFEHLDIPTVDDIKEMLAEEFTTQQIAKSEIRIGHCLQIVLEQRTFQVRLRELFEDIEDKSNTGSIMRALSQHLPREKMNSAFTALEKMGLVKR